MIYLDYAATTPPAPEVIAELTAHLNTHYANASSIHGPGRDARLQVDLVRDRISQMIHARPLEIVFTSGGTEADNLAIIGAIGDRPGAHVISTAVEHQAVLNLLESLAAKDRIELTLVDVMSDGSVDLDQLESAMRPDTALVSLMHVNNETGAIHDLNKIGNMIKAVAPDCLFHTDAVQSFAKLPLNMQELPVDLLSASSHKIYGPKGIGFVYHKTGFEMSKLLVGGHQEFDRRPGTENVPSIAAFGKAIELCQDRMDADWVHASALRQRFRNGLAEIEDITFNSPDNGSPFIDNISFLGCDSEAMVMNLDRHGICVSAGSACTTGSLQMSHVMAAMPVELNRKTSAIRFSYGRHTSEADIDQTIDAVRESVTFLRKLKTGTSSPS